MPKWASATSQRFMGNSATLDINRVSQLKKVVDSARYRNLSTVSKSLKKPDFAQATMRTHSGFHSMAPG